jgi:hypothetical protein
MRNLRQITTAVESITKERLAAVTETHILFSADNIQCTGSNTECVLM